MSKQYKLKDLKKFIKAVEEKYGEKKAQNFRLETMHPFLIVGEKGSFNRPMEIDSLKVAKYEAEKNPVIYIFGGC